MMNVIKLAFSGGISQKLIEMFIKPFLKYFGIASERTGLFFLHLLDYELLPIKACWRCLALWRSALLLLPACRSWILKESEITTDKIQFEFDFFLSSALFGNYKTLMTSTMPLGWAEQSVAFI